MSVVNSMHANRALILKEVLLNRRSVRQFQDKPIGPDVLADILAAAIHAPSGSNSQNQRFLVIECKEELQALGAIRFIWPYRNPGAVRSKQPFGLIGNAAAAIIVFADAALTDAKATGEYYIWESLEIQNCAASIENMLNMAAAHGVGSCWLSASEYMTRTRLLSGHSWSKALAVYAIPASYKIQGIVILGHPRAGLDENGFPRGEAKHGATIYQPVQRNEASYYLIPKRSLAPDECIKLTWRERAALNLFSRLIRILLFGIRKAERAIHRIEIQRALAEILEKKRVESRRYDGVQDDPRGERADTP